MNVSNCRGCGRLFNVTTNPRLCPECVKKLEDKFQEVKKYLYQHPGAGMEEVSRENEVPIQQIKQWVREERLVFGEDAMSGIECELCGKMIRSGKYCDECKLQLANNLMSALDKPTKSQIKKPVHDRDCMRFL